MATVAATALVLGAVITERHRAETALRESEERYRRLIEISPDAVTLIAPDGAILLCNEQAATAPRKRNCLPSCDPSIGRSCGSSSKQLENSALGERRNAGKAE
jgi:hypothetical protein